MSEHDFKKEVIGKLSFLLAQIQEDKIESLNKLSAIHLDIQGQQLEQVANEKRFDRIEKYQSECPGKKAMESVNKYEAEKGIKNTKKYKYGAVVVNFITAAVVLKAIDFIHGKI